jgi:hypothetical protein
MRSNRLSGKALRLVLLFLIPLAFSFNYGTDNVELSVESKKAKSGNTYTIFLKKELKMLYTLKRPNKNDKSILLCIPAAFTDLANLNVDGLSIENGTVTNRKVNYTLGGAIKIINGDCEIFPTNKGKLLNDSLIKQLTSRKASLFQQIQLIERSSGAKFKDKKEFQRRAIVKLKGNKTAVIESFEHITLEAFTRDLLELGVTDALYTDMGSWDEGWYRKGNEIKTIGRLRTQTGKQSNWVIFKK